jgi:hypothetical protein
MQRRVVGDPKVPGRQGTLTRAQIPTGKLNQQAWAYHRVDKMGKGGPLHGLGYMAMTTRMQGAEHGPAITSGRGAGYAVRARAAWVQREGKSGQAHGMYVQVFFGGTRWDRGLEQGFVV